MSDRLLAVDGGGSKTRVLVADEAGTVLGAAEASTSNARSAGADLAREALSRAIGDAALRAGVPSGEPFAAACFGLAGMDRAADRAAMTEWLEGRAIARRILVVHDTELVLAAGTAQGVGLALIAGTGSVCHGKNADGRTARAGGWGWLLGDEGSGHDLGVGALRVATQTADGRAGARAVLGAVLEAWHLTEPEELLDRAYDPRTTRADIARLADPIVRLAEEGEPAAARLLDHAALELGRLVDAVAGALGARHLPLVFAGGLLRGSERLQRAVLARIETPLGDTSTVDDPALGALALARRLAADP